jgi:innexin
MHEHINDDDDHRHEQELKYYQWTPFILLLMAILFYVPHQCWRGLSLRSGVDLKDLIEAAQTFRSANIRHDDKIKLLEYLTNWLNNYCSNGYRLTAIQTRTTTTVSRKAKIARFGQHLFFPLGIYTGNYLIISYLLIKFLYLFNSIGQIVLLNALLGRNFWFYGIEIVYRYWTKQIGLLYTGNEYFPKVVSITRDSFIRRSTRFRV